MQPSRIIKHIRHRISPKVRERGAVLRSFARTTGLVYFGSVDQHDDEHSPVHGFTASLTHRDSHYALGTYEGYDICVLNRFDTLPLRGGKTHAQLWTILEIKLEHPDLPHIFFMPTGPQSGEYSRLFTAFPHLQPLNSMLGASKNSPSFHGRYQILARTTYAQEVGRLLKSPTIVGIGERLWPYGIEIHRGKLFVYLIQKPTKRQLETCLASALWLAERIDED